MEYDLPGGLPPLQSVSNFDRGAFPFLQCRDIDELSLQLSNFGIGDIDKFDSVVRRGSPMFQFYNSLRSGRMTTLPPWTLDENKEIRNDLTLYDVVEKDLLVCFAMDKAGCHFLQSNFYGENTKNIDPILRDRICHKVVSNREIFLTLSKNIFGNFFLQRVIEFSRQTEQEFIRQHIVSDITALCLDKSGCRVIQTSLEKLRPRYADSLVDSIPRDERLMAICTDQNANHVIQKIVKKLALRKWEFLVDFFCKRNEENLLKICQDKYGCRVVQTVVEVLSTENRIKDNTEKCRVLHKLMGKILSRCQNLASNEFANYVIQHIIETPGVLSEYRDAIIEKCLLRNLLSMSQEKYASHVVERAFTYAPVTYLTEMMEEIFEGYVPHPETGKDALDILIFHQFGNYVVQRMLQICRSAVIGERDTIANGINYRDRFDAWLRKLYIRAKKERTRLMRFSSGKKIIEIFEGMEQAVEFTASMENYASSSIMSPSAGSTGWTSPFNF
ncbi:unnamed protein product [Caenorhabditis bovis]|uniref:PUM-HD domain-containing protein n=1 Tax=Caenorhabditis bovis TaxID=2654633 RepID=A0A8S1ERE3_9PELO|nr:unnamed protein product [Caenorhabditis bovis]